MFIIIPNVALAHLRHMRMCNDAQIVSAHCRPQVGLGRTPAQTLLDRRRRVPHACRQQTDGLCSINVTVDEESRSRNGLCSIYIAIDKKK